VLSLEHGACATNIGGSDVRGNLCARHHGQGSCTPMARSVAGVGGGSVGGAAQSGTAAHLAGHAGRRSRARLLAFPPMAPWWSAGLTTPQGSIVPFAGRRRVGCRTSARWAAMGAGLGAFPPMAPWWSAGLTTPQGSIVPFAGRRRRGMQDLGTLPGAADRWLSLVATPFPPMAPWWSAGLTTPQGGSCLSLDGGGWDAGPRHAGRQ
jgi:hypothetical protein